MSALSPSPLSVVALASAVLVTGVAAAMALGGAADPTLAAPPPPAASPTASPVSLKVARAPAAAAAFDAADPTTWPTRQLAAQLVFSCVQSRDVATIAAQAAAGIGGIAVMGRPTDRGALSAGLARARAGAPHGIGPLMASDEEGGRVQRLKSLLGPLPSAAVMGRWPDARIQQTAQAYGAGMRGLGIQLALSPVADLAAPGGYPAATERAFSGDPQRVAGAAVAWSRGLQAAGVLSAVKHWPGHGSATDSHAAAPAAPALAQLERRDLLPFDAVLRSGASLVMIGHLRSAGLTEPGLPATLSPNALRVLRGRAGPATVLLTDSVSMAASSSAVGLTPPQAAVRALQAGADWAMSCVNPLGAANAVQAALDTGALPRARAEASARRILAVKHRLGLAATPPSTVAPSGSLDTAQLLGHVVTLTGKAVDPDTPTPPVVRITADGIPVAEVLPDPATRVFRMPIAALAGSELCAVAVNTGRGRSTPLGCVRLPERQQPVS